MHGLKELNVKKVSVTMKINYHGVLEFVSVSFEVFPSKLKKFENSLKLPGVLFSISLIIYTDSAHSICPV